MIEETRLHLGLKNATADWIHPRSPWNTYGTQAGTLYVLLSLCITQELHRPYTCVNLQMLRYGTKHLVLNMCRCILIRTHLASACQLPL